MMLNQTLLQTARVFASKQVLIDDHGRVLIVDFLLITGEVVFFELLNLLQQVIEV